jgi:ABC-type glutathione transport system ATPase component
MLASLPGYSTEGFMVVGSPLLSVEELTIAVDGNGGRKTPVRDVAFQVAPGEIAALVGGQGSGKTLTSLAVMGLLSCSFGRIAAGRLLLRRRSGDLIDLASLSADNLRTLRGSEIAMVFQEPMTSLNPLLTVGEQIA